VDVPAVNLLDLSQPPPSETSQIVAARVTKSRELQKIRYQEFGGATPIRTNAEADGTLLEKVTAPDGEGRQLLLEAAVRMRLSPSFAVRSNAGGFGGWWNSFQNSYCRSASLPSNCAWKEFSCG